MALAYRHDKPARRCDGRFVQAWRIHEYGDPGEVLRLDEVEAPTPGAGQLGVRVESLAINWNDVDGILGRYETVKPPLPFIPGMEIVGRVEACGEGAAGWKGKRVCAVPDGAFGGYAEYAVCPTAMAFEMPENLAPDDAAAIYFPFHLASLSLFERGRLSRGETVLIHAAAGGVGSAAVQLARASGARVIATAGSAEKVASCRRLGAELAIDYRKEDFAHAVLDATDGRGVDVVLDSVGGEVTRQSMRCMAFNARLLAIGFASGIEIEDESHLTPRPWLFGNFSYCGVCLAYVDEPILFKKATGLNFPGHADGEVIHQRVLQLFADGKVETVIGQRRGFEELPLAFEAITKRTVLGRSVIVV